MRNAIVLSGLVGVLFLSGCGTTMVKEKDIVNYDPESMDVFHEEGKPTYEDAPDHIVVAKEDGILVDVHRIADVFDEQADVERQRWNVFVTNTSHSDQCVGILWRLLDFKFITEHPTTTLVEENSMLHLGTMLGRVWEIDGVSFAPPPSGYVQAMQVRDPIKDAKAGDECLFLASEDEITVDEGSSYDHSKSMFGYDMY